MNIGAIPGPWIRFLVRSYFAIVDITSPDDERLVAKIHEWFWWTVDVAVPDQLGWETAEA